MTISSARSRMAFMRWSQTRGSRALRDSVTPSTAGWGSAIPLSLGMSYPWILPPSHMAALRFWGIRGAVTRVPSRMGRSFLMKRRYGGWALKRSLRYKDASKKKRYDWVICRFSGAEPLLRMAAEADSGEKAEQLIGKWKELLSL